jgi:hypothetical protein
MKKIFAIIVLLTAVLFYSAAQQSTGENVTWKVVNYSLLDQEVMSQGIADMISEGYYPVGLEVLANRDLSVMYERIFTTSTRYYVQYFSDIANLSRDFAAFLQEGWAPADVAFFNEGMFALFMETGADMRGWRMLSVDGESDREQQQSMDRIVTESAEAGYIPFGLSRYQERLMVGFTTPHRSTHAGIEGGYRIEAYPNDGVSFVRGIDARLEEGYHIAGYHFDEGQVYIAFLK